MHYPLIGMNAEDKLKPIEPRAQIRPNAGRSGGFIRPSQKRFEFLLIHGLHRFDKPPSDSASRSLARLKRTWAAPSEIPSTSLISRTGISSRYRSTTTSR